ncbi:unnamed protein product [Mucor hiemalis]
MTPEEQEEQDRIKNELENYQDDNDKLSRMMADLTAENVKLKAMIRTSRNNANQTPNTQENEDSAELQRKLRQAKLKIEEQHRMIQILQTKNNNTRIPFSSQSDDSNSVLSDKENGAHFNRQLEGELRKERIHADRILRELQERKDEIHDLQVEIDEYAKTLHDTKQQLRSVSVECDELREKNDKIRVDSKDMNKLIKAASELQQENDELLNVVQSRDQDIAELEAEVEKLLLHVEEKGDNNENINEEALQEREEEIDLLKKELKTITESHDEDIEAFEQHISQCRSAIDEKEQECKELRAEMDELKKDFEGELEKQYNDMIVSVRDREVRIATLEGNFEQKTDTMQRERKLLSEEIEELKDEIHDMFDQLKEKENMINELTNMLNHTKDSETSFLHQTDKMEGYNQKWPHKVEILEEKLKNTQETMKHERALAKEERIHQNNALRALKQKILSANKKNEILSNLVEQQRRLSGVSIFVVVSNHVLISSDLGKQKQYEIR